jgi:hypothetical protein
MAIVMGLDQHRAKIAAEWIDTDTGEISRARVSPAHRDNVWKFFERFAGQPLDVALEAMTGWRFFLEELRAIGAAAHLAEPAETAARRGNKKRAKTGPVRIPRSPQGGWAAWFARCSSRGRPTTPAAAGALRRLARRAQLVRALGRLPAWPVPTRC